MELSRLNALLEGVHVGREQPYAHLELSGLPRLPVPEVRATLDRYLRYVRPLVPETQFSETERAVAAFRDSADAADLQRRLHQLDAESPTSWLEGFWDTGYLEYRVPVTVHVSPFFTFRRVGGSQVAVAARYVHGSLRFYGHIRDGSLAPDQDGKGGGKLCMTQYGRLFASYRLPLPGRDAVYTATHTRHIVVSRSNPFY